MQVFHNKNERKDFHAQDDSDHRSHRMILQKNRVDPRFLSQDHSMMDLARHTYIMHNGDHARQDKEKRKGFT